MRRPRVKGTGRANYHIFSRVVNRERVFDAEEKRRFVELMRAVEEFCGVKVLTYTVLSNHFHILLHIPKRRDLNDDEFLKRLRCLYKKREVRRIENSLRHVREAGEDAAAERLKERYTYRMYDLSEFGKTLLQRFSQSFNNRHDRTGTLWEARFGSLLVGGSMHALRTVAAYIDLNAVRAGLVSDPVDYRWSGYAEAVGGSRRAREGLGLVVQPCARRPDWRKAARDYRLLLYAAGRARGTTATGASPKRGFSPEEVRRVLEEGGELPLHIALRCRIRYFTDGVVLGSRVYVGDMWRRYGQLLDLRPNRGPCQMVGCEWGDLCTIRPLRGEIITVPDC